MDIDPAEIGKNVRRDVPIVGDVKRVLRALTPLVRELDAATRADWIAQLARVARAIGGGSWHGSGAWRDGLLSADYVIGRLGELTDHDATLVVRRRPAPDVAGAATPASAGRTRTSPPAASARWAIGVPAAMGAALGRPDKETWAVVGDGGFQMTSQELMTLAAGPHPGEDRAHGQQEARA